jgi:hypothetical protein
LPSTFGGTSGGGLWQVDISGSKEKGYKIGKKTLMGVAFYETGISDNKMHIRCNGPKGVYQIAPDILERIVKKERR